jgi:hypothetical protein
MNTRAIAEEITKAIEDAQCLVTDEDVIEMVLDRHLEGVALVPREPTDRELDGLARAIMLWMDMDERKTPDNLRAHLKNMGEQTPEWMSKILATVEGCHVMPKGMRCLLVYKAMIAAAEKSKV